MNDDDGEEETSTIFLYSLSRHEIARRATVVDGAVEFEANEEFVVIVCASTPIYFFSFQSYL
jgi:hypothetical protein